MRTSSSSEGAWGQDDEGGKKGEGSREAKERWRGLGAGRAGGPSLGGVRAEGQGSAPSTPCRRGGYKGVSLGQAWPNTFTRHVLGNEVPPVIPVALTPGRGSGAQPAGRVPQQAMGSGGRRPRRTHTLAPGHTRTLPRSKCIADGRPEAGLPGKLAAIALHLKVIQTVLREQRPHSALPGPVKPLQGELIPLEGNRGLRRPGRGTAVSGTGTLPLETAPGMAEPWSGSPRTSGPLGHTSIDR